jgi:hypothetical protein
MIFLEIPNATPKLLENFLVSGYKAPFLGTKNVFKHFGSAFGTWYQIQGLPVFQILKKFNFSK